MKYFKEDDYVRCYTSNGIEFLIDIDDYDKVKPYSWCVSSGYVHRTHNKTDIKLHRLIMNCPDDLYVDHKNHDTLDNRKSNLRVCSVSENNRNISFMSNNTSGRVGVYWKKSRSKWVAQIKVNGKVKHLGVFTEYEDAVKCRVNAEKFYFGEFAPLTQW